MKPCMEGTTEFNPFRVREVYSNKFQKYKFKAFGAAALDPAQTPHTIKKTPCISSI